MALVVGKNQPNHLASVEILEDEEDDLFEINLEVVDKTPPPDYFWDDTSCFAASAAAATTGGGTTRFANCLLPVEKVSSAVPAKSFDEVPGGSSRRWSFTETSWFLMTTGAGQPLTLGKLLELPLSRALMYDNRSRGI